MSNGERSPSDDSDKPRTYEDLRTYAGLTAFDDVEAFGDLPEQVVAEVPILLDGSLPELSIEERGTLAGDTSGVDDIAPRLIYAIQEKYGDSITQRELNLIETGSQLVLYVLQRTMYAEAEEKGIEHPFPFE